MSSEATQTKPHKHHRGKKHHVTTKEVFSISNPNAPTYYVEAFKMIASNIEFIAVAQECKSILVTSTIQDEGKTNLSTNLALALSGYGKKVCIVDCDLRRPQIHNVLSIGFAPGLTNYLNGECTKEEVIRSTKINNLSAITYGAIPPNPSELLSSVSMIEFIKELEKEFDYIIFDTPPVGVVIDSLPLVKQSDGVVLVIKHNSTTYPDLKKITETINRNNGKILGVIVNNVESVKSHKYGKGYGYGYGYGY